MEDPRGMYTVHHRVESRSICDVDGLEVRLRRDTLRPPSREVVEDHDAGTVCDQSVHQMGADEPGAAGYKSSVASHGVIGSEAASATSPSGAALDPEYVCT